MVNPISKTRRTTLIHVHFVNAIFTAVVVIERRSEEVNGRHTIDAVVQDGSKLIDDVIIRSRHIVREDDATRKFH